jgi:hypothetical protein
VHEHAAEQPPRRRPSRDGGRRAGATAGRAAPRRTSVPTPAHSADAILARRFAGWPRRQRACGTAARPILPIAVARPATLV